MSPLSRSEADDVLCYFLAALRLEEALEVRPDARRTPHRSEPPRLDMPTPGQDYFKLPLDGELAALLSHEQPLERPMDGELNRFFETWLHGQYRRSGEDSELSHLLCFPVVHLSRGELAGLLRCGVTLRFGENLGQLFRVPTFAERQRGLYPAPPYHAYLARAARTEGAWPFFVDTRLLRHPLGVPSESIDALFEALRARERVCEEDMLRLVTETLESAAQGEPVAAKAKGRDTRGVEAWLARLTQAMRRLLEQAGTRAQVYPVGIVLDGSQAKTTWHLQRELTGLLEARGDAAWSASPALRAYLTGRKEPSDRAAQRALYPGTTLTPSQRNAAEHFWGTTLTSVQGPPGTGKTTLILHLCAEALLCQVEALVDTGAMGDRPLVVASSNNRAVDNVLESLANPSGLPLALRAGSRQICEQALAGQLRQTLAWLKSAHGRRSPAELDHAIADFRAQRAELDLLLAPRTQAEQRRRERSRLNAALAAHQPAQPSSAEDPRLTRIPEAALDELVIALGHVERRFLALSKLCEAKPGLAQVNAVARHFGHTASRELTVFEGALERAGLTLDLPLPPLSIPAELPALMEAWEDGTELCLARLSDLRERLVRVQGARKSKGELERLTAELVALGEEPDGLPEVPAHDELSHRLFAACVRVREAWAGARAAELVPAVEAALLTIERERSLRPLFRNDPHHARLLCRLFGLWGSTLLSLGNCFPAEPGHIGRVIIDEAGQCHPAHALSALLRAEAALVIGDVHQLAPVVELNADDEARLFQSCRLKSAPARLFPYRIHADAQVSAQTLADRAVSGRLALVDHFRCQPEIIAISDALCGYGLTVHTPRANRSAEVSFLSHPVSMLDLAGEQERFAGSLCNELELEHTLRLLQRILQAGIGPTDLAVITPYRGQLERLRRGFAQLSIPIEYSAELAEGELLSTRTSQGVALGTVHRFQGGERSIVLFSSVVTRPSSLAFLDTRPNLLNVAVSRARHHFVCLGHRAVLEQGKKTRLLVRAARPLASP
jgi:hypothetical protein